MSIHLEEFTKDRMKDYMELYKELFKKHKYYQQLCKTELLEK